MPTQTAGINKAYITECIADLAELLPVRPSANAAELYALLHAGKVKECVEAIAAYLNLPIKINLLEVRPGDTSENQFHSRDLVNTDESGRGTEGITAQVLIPRALPLFGSKEFQNFAFTVKVSQGCAKQPRVFVAIMAHELSHVVLNSLWYTDRDSEIKTDLTAMLLGFADAMKNGRKHVWEEVTGNQRVTHTTTYGYLSDELFEDAYIEISRLCSDEQNQLFLLQRKIAAIRSGLEEFNKELKSFEDGLIRLDSRGIAKSDPEDGKKLVSFHGVGFLDTFRTQALSIKSRCDAISLDGLRPHTKAGAEVTKHIEDAIGALERECQRLNNEMGQNNATIRKYLALSDRLKYRFRDFRIFKK